MKILYSPDGLRQQDVCRPSTIRRLFLLMLSFLCCFSLTAIAANGQPAPSADISVSKTGDSSAPVGGQIGYNIVVTDGGPDDATNVVLTDAIPANTTFVNASVSQGTVGFDGTTITASFGTITAFNSATLTLTVSVNTDTPRGTTISNTATATSDTADPDTSNNSSTALTAVTGPFSGDLLISEFRFRGPVASATPTDGTTDEFVEIYNNTDTDFTVADSSGGSGWALVSSDDTVTPKFVIPNGTVIPARGHYLGVNSNGYSLNGYPGGEVINAVGDTSYTTNIPDDAGIALFRTTDSSGFNAVNRFDAVGFGAVTNTIYREGNGLSVSPVTVPVQHAFVRKLATGTPQDTNNNATDFRLVATDGDGTLASAELGAPGPENLFAPIQRNATITPSMIEPAVSPAVSPNRVRSGSGNSGTLSMRNRFTNNTGQTVTRLRFRVINITTLGTPISVAPQADIRVAISSSDFNITTSLGALTVKGTILEQPPTQNIGGGENSSVTVALPSGGLAPGNTIDVQFLLNIVRAGNFRFFVNMEAITPSTQTFRSDRSTSVIKASAK